MFYKLGIPKNINKT